MAARRTPTAKKLKATPGKTVWLIQWPSTMFVEGKSYIATTFDPANPRPVRS